MTPEIEEKKTYLLHWMYDFIEDIEEDDEPAYHKSDVEQCDQIVTAFINSVNESKESSDLSWLSSRIEQLVMQLNEINNTLDKQLIETNQREDLCALIELVISHCGHQPQGDITEKWRQW